MQQVRQGLFSYGTNCKKRGAHWQADSHTSGQELPFLVLNTDCRDWWRELWAVGRYLRDISVSHYLHELKTEEEKEEVIITTDIAPFVSL
jgi:hypothetical protein